MSGCVNKIPEEITTIGMKLMIGDFDEEYCRPQQINTAAPGFDPVFEDTTNIVVEELLAFTPIEDDS
jgi:hypothetical protein